MLRVAILRTRQCFLRPAFFGTTRLTYAHRKIQKSVAGVPAQCLDNHRSRGSFDTGVLSPASTNDSMLLADHRDQADVPSILLHLRRESLRQSMGSATLGRDRDLLAYRLHRMSRCAPSQTII